MGLITLIKYLPYLLELIDAIKKYREEQQIQGKISDDIKKITEAFNEKDADKLNAVFANKLPK